MKNIKKIVLIAVSFIVFASIAVLAAGAELVTETFAGDTEGTYVTMTYDTVKFSMTITHDNPNWQELQPVTDSGNSTVQDFLDKYRTEVESIDIGKFSKIQIYTKLGAKLFEGMTALRSVHFAAGQDIILNHQYSYKKSGIFSGCTALETVWFGDDINKIEGCANFTGFGSRDPMDYFMKDLFLNCESLTSVIFPKQDYFTAIDSTTFSGCTALKSVTIPANFTTIPDDAFKDCTDLTIKTDIGTTAFDFSVANEYFKYLWDTKPDISKAHDHGYLIQMSNKVASDSNIKWELHNEGTAANPEYTLYLYIDDTVDSTNTVIHSGCRDWTGTTPNSNYVGSDGYVKNPGWIGSAQYQYQAYYCADVPNTSIKRAVIGDEITAFANAGGILLGLTGLETVELPASLTQMQYPVFTGCSSLSTVYIRDTDSVPVKGTVDLSKISSTRINWCWYYFGGCSSVEQYIFYEGFNSSGNIAGGTFQNNTSLKSINLNSRNVGTIGKNAFLNCTSLEKVTLDDSATAISVTSFTNCTNLREIEFLGDSITIAVDSAATDRAGVTANNSANSFQNCPNLTKLSAPIGSDAHAFAIKYGFDTTQEIITTNNDALLAFNPENGAVTITKVGTEYAFYYDDANAQRFFDAYRTDITSVKVGSGFGKLSGSSTIGMFEGMTSLVSVNFPENQRFSDYYKENSVVVGYGSLFKGCTSLTTVWFGGEEAKKEGVVDFSGMRSNKDDTPWALTMSLFEGCSSIVTVILPDLVSSGDGIAPMVYTDTFAGCSALQSIVIPSAFSIEDGAFDNCASIKTIVLQNGGFADSEDMIFPDIEGLSVICVSDTVAESLNKAYTNTEAVAIDNTVTAYGFSIRLNTYNGLRGVFSFDEARNKTLANIGVELQEYGALVVSREQYEALGSVKIGKISTGYVTNAAAVKKIPVYIKGAENNGMVGSLLPSSTSDIKNFAVTVVKFADNFDSDLYMCAYSVYKDPFGEEYIEYANYGENVPDYEFISLYDMTLNMYKANAEGILNKVVDEKAVWNTLIQGTYVIGDVREITLAEGVSMMVVTDAEGANYVFVRGADKTTAEAYREDATEKAAEAGYTVADTFAIAVTDIANYDAGYVTPAEAKTYETSVGPTYAYNKATHKAQHPQGMTTDGEYIYISLTRVILKIRISDGEEVGKFTVSDELIEASGFHMGDMVYHDGKLYGGLTGWSTDKSYFGIIDVDDLKGNVSDEILYAAYLPEGKGLGEGYHLSDGSSKYSIGGIDGTAKGTIPGKGYIDADGNVHEDNKVYLLTSFSGGTNGASTDTAYDNDNYMIGAYSFEEVLAAAKPLTAARVKSEETAEVVSKYRMFVYTGACDYGAQTLEVDKDTGDYIMNMYGRTSDSVYPNVKNGAIVIDGAKMLYTDTIDVGQSSPNADALARAELYMDADGNYPTELFMTLKCHCDKNDINAHDKIAYGDTGYAFRFCDHILTSYPQGCISLGNDYYYTLNAVSGSSDTVGWPCMITLRKLNHYIGAWSYSAVN